MSTANFRPDEDTLLGHLMRAVKNIADEQGKQRSDNQQLKTMVNTIARKMDDLVAETRRYHKHIQDRFEEEISTDYDDISGSHDVKSLRDAGRNWRKRFHEEEQAKLQVAAKAQLEEMQRQRVQRYGAMAAPFVLGFGVAIWEFFKATVVK